MMRIGGPVFVIPDYSAPEQITPIGSYEQLEGPSVFVPPSSPQTVTMQFSYPKGTTFCTLLYCRCEDNLIPFPPEF